MPKLFPIRPSRPISCSLLAVCLAAGALVSCVAPVIDEKSAVSVEVAKYLPLLVNSVKGWEEFERRFRGIANTTLSEDGSESVLRGTTEAFGVKNSTFEARFASPTQIKRLLVTLAPANPGDRQLRGDLSNRIAKGQPNLEEWLPQHVRAARDRLLVERIEVEFGGANLPTKATLVSKIQMPFQPVAGIPVSMAAMEFIFTVTDPANRTRAGLTMTLAGDVPVGTGVARFSGTSASKDSPAAWSLKAELGSVALQTLLESIAGQAALNGITIPRELSALPLRQAVIEIDQAKGTVSARATSDLGNVALQAAAGRGGLTFQLGVALQPGFKFASLAPELGVIDDLRLDGCAIVIAPGVMPVDLPNLVSVAGAGVPRGVTLLGGFNVRAAVPRVADALKVDVVAMRGTFGSSMADVRMQGPIAAQIALAPNSTVAVLRGIRLRLIPGAAGPTLELGGKVDVKAHQQTLTFDADVGIDFAGPSLHVSGKLSAVDGKAAAHWSNPFGIARGLHVKDLGLALGINLGAPVPLPILGLQGELVAGDIASPEFHGRAAIGIDSGDPQKAVIDVGFDQLIVRQIMNAAAPQVVPAIPPDMQYALDIGLRDARLTIVPSSTGANLFGQQYDPGFLVQGKARVGEWEGELYAAVDYERGLEARARGNPLTAEPWFALKGARGQPAPWLNIRLEPGPGSFVAMSGLATALGLQTEADVLLYRDGFGGYLAGKVFGGAFDAKVEVSGRDLKSGGSLYAIAEMKSDLFNYVAENASRQIDAASRDMQGQIATAQRARDGAQREIASFNSQIADYIAQRERERNQACASNRDNDPNVRAADQRFAFARNQLDNVANDPGVVAARTQLATSETNMAVARQRASNVDQDPDVVMARNRHAESDQNLVATRQQVERAIEQAPVVGAAGNRLRFAQREAESARAGVDPSAIDSGRDVQIARQAFDQAKNRVNELESGVRFYQGNLNEYIGKYNRLHPSEMNGPAAVQLRQQMNDMRAAIARVQDQLPEAANQMQRSEQALAFMRGSVQQAANIRFANANAELQAAEGNLAAMRQAAWQRFGPEQQSAERAVESARQLSERTFSAVSRRANFEVQNAEGAFGLYRQAYETTVQSVERSAQEALRAADDSLQGTRAQAEAVYQACIAVPIPTDARLNQLNRDREVPLDKLREADRFLEGVRQAATGTMVAADWIVKNGGNPSGVVKIEYAKFEGCLAALEGGKVLLDFRGEFAGRPMQGAVDLNFASPAEAVTYLARYLVENKQAPQQVRANPCEKPSFAGRPGNAGSRGLDAGRVPASPRDLNGPAPTIARVEKPAGLGRLPKGE